MANPGTPLAVSGRMSLPLPRQGPGLDTNLLIPTDRRAYYLRLISKPEAYVARAAFAYPEDDSAAKWQRQEAAQKAPEKANRKVAPVEMEAHGGILRCCPV